MKENKFRAWDEEKKEWINPSQIAISAIEGHLMYWISEKDIWVEYYTDKFIIMQYTLRKDKNGREIYEGDILKSKSEVPQFGNYTEKRYKDVYTLINSMSVFLFGHIEYEVIGNIYENPELLEEKKNERD